MTGPRKAGRPQVGPQVKIAFEPELLARVDRAAAEFGLTRSAWVRAACERALPRIDLSGTQKSPRPKWGPGA